MTRMDPRMADRRRAVQETHARRSLRRLMRVLILSALVAAGLWAFRSPLLAVQIIEVRGAEQVDAVQVLRRNGVVEGIPMMDVDLEGAAAALLDDPWVASAAVAREWPQSITVEISERTPVAWVAAQDGWAHVAIDGVMLSRADVPDQNAPVLVLPDVAASLLPEDREAVGVLEFLTNLPPELAAGARIGAGESGFEGIVGGYEVRIGSGNDGRLKALALAAVIETAPDEGSIITVIAPGQPAVMAPGAAPDGDVEGQDTSESTTNPEDG